MNWERHIGWLVLAWRAQRAEVDPRRARAWASGEWTPSYDDLVEVEQVAGLAPKSMTSLAGLLRVPLDIAAPDPADADPLRQAAITNTATAAQWSDLGRLIRTHPELAPSGDDLDRMTWNLINALPRGVKHAYRLMRVAALNVARVPELCDQVVETVRICLEDVEGPAFLEPIGLLDQLSTPEAHALILDLMERPRSRPQRRYAAGLAAQVLLRGAFTADERARVVMNVLAGWRSDPEEAEEDLGQVVDAYPGGLAAVLAREGVARRHRREPMAGAPVEPDAFVDVEEPQATRMSDALVKQVLSEGDEVSELLGPDLAAMLRQALCFRNTERRLRAGQVLSSSPYGPAVADGLIELLHTPDVSPTVRRRAAALFNNVIGERNVLGALGLVGDDDVTVAASITTSFGHTTYSDVADQVIRQAVPAERLPMGRACLYALGMTGSPGIAAMVAAPRLPSWQRHTARWWHTHGSAIHA